MIENNEDEIKEETENSQENHKYPIFYKINTNQSYKVYENMANGRTYYKVQVTKKNYDGTQTSYYKQIKFAKCNPPKNGEIIKIKKGFEDLYTNSKDKYNPISVIVVTDYELIRNNIVDERQAYQTYREKLKEDYDAFMNVDNFLD